MQLEENRQLFLSDTLVPDVFILDYMPSLSGLAVKVYIYLLTCTRTQTGVTEMDLVRRMDEDMDSVKAAFVELESAGLLQRISKGYAITDIKAKELDRTYRPRTSTTTDPGADTAPDPERVSLINDISKTFYQGLMSPSWYGIIETWFDRYGFEPEVLYSLFQVCKQNNKLGNKNYIVSVAEDWGRRGLTTFHRLNEYFESRDRVRVARNLIGRKLRKNMTEYDDKFIEKWLDKFGFSMEVIELALSRAVRIAQPNMAFFDKILTDWFSHGLKTPKDVENYEKERAARRGLSASGGGAASGGRRPANVGNFRQRDYEPGFIESLYEDVTGASGPDASDGKDILSSGAAGE